MPEIDVLLPTARNHGRLPTLLSNIRTALSSPIPTRVTVAMGGSYVALMKALSDEEHDRVRIIQNAPEGLMGIPAALHCLDTLDWSGWLYWLGDDDVLLPWGLEHLFEHRKHVSMVIGNVFTLTKDGHWPHPRMGMIVGSQLEGGRVSGVGCLFKIRDLLSLPRPLMRLEDTDFDFGLITRMADKFPYICISPVVAVMCAEGVWHMKEEEKRYL